MEILLGQWVASVTIPALTLIALKLFCHQMYYPISSLSFRYTNIIQPKRAPNLQSMPRNVLRKIIGFALPHKISISANSDGCGSTFNAKCRLRWNDEGNAWDQPIRGLRRVCKSFFVPASQVIYSRIEIKVLGILGEHKREVFWKDFAPYVEVSEVSEASKQYEKTYWWAVHHLHRVMNGEGACCDHSNGRKVWDMWGKDQGCAVCYQRRFGVVGAIIRF
ncbi:uncharacterized protein AB675_11812 [Cyphellophora attinorum]|uniref:Uncharacterized protein n=1 Tax=Cyphellophora attinorum TaxID=1664694 RepID=A0A0N1NX02_9EURO|nr:uncharacterized protein AB675_11812 [Phialophora attinorum]KPI36865.1 hypothetical protein AB675_11812 [Phialophora attinorum]